MTTRKDQKVTDADQILELATQCAKRFKGKNMLQVIEAIRNKHHPFWRYFDQALPQLEVPLWKRVDGVIYLSPIFNDMVGGKFEHKWEARLKKQGRELTVAAKIVMDRFEDGTIPVQKDWEYTCVILPQPLSGVDDPIVEKYNLGHPHPEIAFHLLERYQSSMEDMGLERIYVMAPYLSGGRGFTAVLYLEDRPAFALDEEELKLVMTKEHQKKYKSGFLYVSYPKRSQQAI